MIMSFNKPIRRIAVVGTGVIGVNWAAEHLAIRVPHAKSVNLQINGNTKNTVTDGLFYHDLGGSRDLSTNPQPVLHQRFRQLGIRQSRWIKLANVTGRVEQSRQERIYDSQNDNNLTARCERRN